MQLHVQALTIYNVFSKPFLEFSFISRISLRSLQIEEQRF